MKKDSYEGEAALSSEVSFGYDVGRKRRSRHNVPGSFAYTPGAGTVLPAGQQTLNVTFTPTDTTKYTTATASVTLTVNKAAPIITWSTPASITFGTPLSATQLNATANVAGSFAYAPPIGTVLNVGMQTLSATFTPSDTVDYATATSSVSLSVVSSGAVVVTLSDSTGNPLAGGVVQYYSGSWKPFGTTDATGRTSMNLGTYSFSMNYAGATVQVSQNVGTNPLVSFQTTKTIVLLKDSSGNPLDSGTVQFYATTWQPFGAGSTSGDQVATQLLPTSYSFAMTYLGARIQVTQNITPSANTVTFQTTLATLLLRDSSGNPL